MRTTVVLGHARGVVLLAGEQAGIAIHEFPPAEIKKAVVGTGAATKEQVQFMLTRLLRLQDGTAALADAADGVAAALTLPLARASAATARPRARSAIVAAGSCDRAGRRHAARARSSIASRS